MKRKNISIIIPIMMMSGAWGLHSQDVIYPNALPSSSSMGLVASVNHTTGNVNVSVPLLNFESDGINVPIGISYNTSGIRVEDRGTETGYGWRLIAGGKITRVVKRRPDDISLSSQLWGLDSLAIALRYFTGIEAKFIDYNEIDGEPDLFYYEIPGKSGMFILDRYNKPHTIPYQSDVTISIVDGSYFMIKDNTGAQYIFGNMPASRETTTVTFRNDNMRRISGKSPNCRNICDECMHKPSIYRLCDHTISGQMCDDCIERYYEKCYHSCGCVSCSYHNDDLDKLNYISTWHLARIVNYQGSAVSFSYGPSTTETVTSSTYINTLINNDPSNVRGQSTDWTEKKRTYSSTSVTNTKIITGINGRWQYVTFSKSGNQMGVITSYLNNVKNKSFEFTYDTYTSNRKFLKQITEVSPNNSRQKLCSFEYNRTRDLPGHNSCNYDTWGYYNGKNNTTHLPRVPNELIEFRDFIKAQGATADKSPSLAHTKANILNAIVYNTGGKVKYTYGLNKHGSTNIGGLRVEKVSYHDENNQEVSSTRYEYSNSVLAEIPMINYFSDNDPKYLNGHLYRSGRVTYNDNPYVGNPIMVSSRPFNDLLFATGAHIMYGTIKEIFSDGSKIEYTYSKPDIPRSYGTIPTYRAVPDNGNDNRYGKVWIYTKSPNKIQDGAPWKPGTAIVPKVSRFWRHGLLLKTQKYDSNNNPVEETTYTYKYDQKNPVIIKGYAPFKYGYDYIFEYQWESLPVLLKSTETFFFNNASSKIKTEYEYDNWMAPSAITQTDAENNKVKITYRYAHSMTHSPSNLNFPTKVLVDKGILAPVETVTYKDNNILSSELIEYGFLRNHSTLVKPINIYYMPQYHGASISQADYSQSTALIYDSRYKLKETYCYDPSGVMLNVTTPEGYKSSYMYEQNDDWDLNNIKIADISGAIYMSGWSERTNQVFHSSFEDEFYYTGIETSSKAKTGQKVYSGSSLNINLTKFIPGDYVLTYWKSTDSGQTWTKVTESVTVTNSTSSKVISNNGWIDEVRILPAGARIKTYTYLPGIGVSSETDHNGITTYREYDTFGRLIRILNNDRHVLEEYEYHIKNERSSGE
ncbi:hypothetical protein LJC45_03510 [Alistipes sp. OttesenSCG-928-B03]|nr:hypothetical protein [Alistipes sp. OttesenSCG-928-B03]